MEVSREGEVIDSGEVTDPVVVSLQPHGKTEFVLDLPPAQGNQYIRFIYRNLKDRPFVSAGDEVGFDQIRLSRKAPVFLPADAPCPSYTEDDRYVEFEGADFRYV